MTARILLLAGTTEARALAKTLDGMPGIGVIASLAGVTREPAPIAGQLRVGGFGGAAGLEAFLHAEGIAALIDATHPFATQMTRNAAEACAAAKIARLRLIRPPWDGDWQEVGSIHAAARALPTGARAFITTGRKELGPFASRTDITGVVRFIEPVADLPPHLTQVTARPPFPIESELALMREQAISHLVSKNAGGAARAKLDAAGELGIPMIMVARPSQPPGPTAHSVEEAVGWVHAMVATGP
ncbi:MAG: cobalt-precorrin-6A reductase [Paracoccaceae bacterium]|nr:cobalt-precorrin-6A reductase [Paracoccaceae bacterium]